LISGGGPEPEVQTSLVNIVTLYLGSRLKAGLMTSTPILEVGSDCWSRFNNHPQHCVLSALYD